MRQEDAGGTASLALAATGLAGLATVVAAVVLRGTSAGTAAAVGVAVVAAFLWTGSIPLAVGPKLGLAGFGAVLVLLTYTLRLILALVVLRLAAEFHDERWLGLGVVIAALVWPAAQFTAFLHGERTGRMRPE